MRELVLCNTELAEEVLISHKGRTFNVRTSQGGQYGHERRVMVFIVKDDCENVRFKTIGILRLFSGNEITRQSESEQCSIIGDTTFKDCLIEAKKYIKKYVDFLGESK